jgi:protein PhnA
MGMNALFLAIPHPAPYPSGDSPGGGLRMSIVVRDSNGTELKEGDNVTLIKDLKVKGTSVTLKRGTMVKGIHLTDDPDEVECRVEKVKGLVLRTEFLKKA